MTQEELLRKVAAYRRQRDRLFAGQLALLALASMALSFGLFPLAGGLWCSVFICSGFGTHIHHRTMEAFAERTQTREEDDMRGWEAFRKKMGAELPAPSWS